MKNAVSAHTARILRKAVKSIQKADYGLDMSVYFAASKSGEIFNKTGFCGTACCLAGEIIIDSGAKTEPRFERDAAAKIAKLTHDQTERLFLLGFWPSNYERMYSEAKTKRGTVRALSLRVEHFIKTGE